MENLTSDGPVARFETGPGTESPTFAVEGSAQEKGSRESMPGATGHEMVDIFDSL